MSGQTKMEQLVQEIVDYGATRARLMDANQVVIDPRVRLKCQVPVCDSYSFNLQCPPNCLTVAEFTTYLARFSRVILVQLEGELLPPDQPEGRPLELERVYKPANDLHQLINRAESRAFTLGFRFAAGFIGGCCKLCPECVGPGGKCRHPFRARPSMEAVGVDVYATSAQAGIPIRFPVKDKVV
ncbi:MAG TPA: DUF2284 domain-containing protein, partial [Bacillota bacterium]|nr:DUF2284 domain-containing protein [Bacillota bacterium]